MADMNLELSFITRLANIFDKKEGLGFYSIITMTAVM